MKLEGLTAMREARDDLSALLAQAVSLVTEEPMEAEAPGAVERRFAIAGSYVQLARCAVERFEGAVNGA